MKLILITGITRSGSTWQYNIVRLALELTGHDVYGCWIGDYDPDNKSEYHIVKIHVYNDKLRKKAWKIFTTIREFDGIEKSLKRMGWYKGKTPIEHAFSNWWKWAMYANHITHYRYISGNTEASEIIDQLKVDYPDSLMSELEKLKLPEKGSYDKVTLLHPNHYE